LANKRRYVKSVTYEFDRAKDALNRAEHGVALSDFTGFDQEPVVTVDERFDYGEPRYRAFGRIDGKGYCLVYTVREHAIRLISFRRARDKEMRRYGR
jgi:uncharacterized protein